MIYSSYIVYWGFDWDAMTSCTLVRSDTEDPTRISRIAISLRSSHGQMRTDSHNSRSLPFPGALANHPHQRLCRSFTCPDSRQEGGPGKARDHGQRQVAGRGGVGHGEDEHMTRQRMGEVHGEDEHMPRRRMEKQVHVATEHGEVQGCMQRGTGGAWGYMGYRVMCQAI
jgi:hypothetical protein